MVERRSDGSIMYTYEEAIKIFGKIPKPHIAIDELILLLLRLLDKPINGKVVMQKEIFLLYNEIKNKLIVVDPYFVKHRYGMFSYKIATLLDLLEHAGLISVSNKRSLKRTKYTLTEKGKKVADKVLEKVSKLLSEKEIERLRELRKGWDQLGHDGILGYVYQRFPEYREKSELKDKYIHIDWGVIES